MNFKGQTESQGGILRSPWKASKKKAILSSWGIGQLQQHKKALSEASASQAPKGNAACNKDIYVDSHGVGSFMQETVLHVSES